MSKCASVNNWGRILYLIPVNDQSKSHADGSLGSSGIDRTFSTTSMLDFRTDRAASAIAAERQRNKEDRRMVGKEGGGG